jgi:acetyl esterase/lipase
VTMRAPRPELEIVLPIPDEPAVVIDRDLVVRGPDGRTIPLDVYRPAPTGGDTSPRPVVVFVHGDGDPETLARAKDWGQYRSWGRLAASRGFVGVTFSHVSTRGWTSLSPVAAEIATVLSDVQSRGLSVYGADPGRVAVWAGSAGVPFGVAAAYAARPEVRAVVACYGPLDLGSNPALVTVSPIVYLESLGARLPSTLVVKAALDRPDNNASIDSFVRRAAELGAPVELITHETGHHAFDIVDDDDRSRAIIERIAGFLATALGVTG